MSWHREANNEPRRHRKSMATVLAETAGCAAVGILLICLFWY